jgi:hypothetical protein
MTQLNLRQAEWNCSLHSGPSKPQDADRYFAIRSTRDAGGDAALIESFAEPVGIVSSVAEQFFCFWQRAQYQCRAFVVAHLPFAQHENDRPPLAITDGM